MGSTPAARSNPRRRGDAMDGGGRASRSRSANKKSPFLLPKGWSGTAVYRCSPHLIPQIVELLSEEQKGFVRKIGFGSLLSMADFEINKALTLWLVERFSCDTEALEFEGGVSIPVRPLVKSVLGIPSGPIQVVQAPYNQYSCTKVKKAKEVAEAMCSITEEEPFCIAFMMVILAIYLAPNTTMLINRSLLGAAQQVGSLKQMDWCGFVADYLFKGIREFKESHAPFVCLKGCVHILSVIFIDLVKHAAFEVPNGFPRLGFVTTEHNKWVASHPFGSLLVCRLEESVYAPVLNNGNGNIVEGGECADSDTNTDTLSNQSATDNDDQNNQHPVSAGPGSLPIDIALETSARSAGIDVTFAQHIVFPRSGEQLRSAGPSSESYSAQIPNGLEVLAAAAESRNRGSPSTMEKHDRSAKRARVELPKSGQVVQAGEATIRMDMSLFSCRVCSHPVKPPVFQCNVGHLACGRCLAELPDEQCQMCEHGGGFSPCPVMDDVVLSSKMKCSHDGCQSYVPYHELDDHQSACPHGPCLCTETGCSFVGAPAALLGHLAALHSVPTHKVRYGSVHQLRVSEPRFLLHGEEDDGAFLLALGVLGMATVVSVVCIRAGASPEPRYAVKLQANGPPPPSSATGSILLEMEAVTSIARPGEVAVEELPAFLTVPPAYLVDCGAYKEVFLDVRIDRM